MTVVCKDGVGNNGESIRVPIKLFVVQDWDDFKARLIADPVVYTLLKQGIDCKRKAEAVDIKDGTYLESLLDKDGRQFMSTASGELRLAWAFSGDWFQIFHNKSAGKKASAGAIPMTCLNLPHALRFLPEYTYLAAILPGDPSNDLINNFTDIFVDEFLRSYEHGTYYNTSPLTNEGFIERSIIALAIHDLPGARKFHGMHSHSSRENFCHLCYLPAAEINNMDKTQWRVRDRATHLRHAREWLQEPAIGKRKTMFSRTGVRWSPFLRLPYWKPHQAVVIDGMHNLFLGVVKNFVREVLGIDEKARRLGERRLPLWIHISLQMLGRH